MIRGLPGREPPISRGEQGQQGRWGSGRAMGPQGKRMGFSLSHHGSWALHTWPRGRPQGCRKIPSNPGVAPPCLHMGPWGLLLPGFPSSTAASALPGSARIPRERSAHGLLPSRTGTKEPGPGSLFTRPRVARKFQEGHSRASGLEHDVFFSPLFLSCFPFPPTVVQDRAPGSYKGKASITGRPRVKRSV